MDECLPGPSGTSEKQKRPMLNYYVRLESESPVSSEEGPESVHSNQGYETAYAVDTPDTDSSPASYFEYELESSDHQFSLGNATSTSSGAAEFILGENLVAAIIDATSREGSVSEEESSGSDSAMFFRSIKPCVKCNLSRNKHPRLQFCKKCFQARRNLFPPPPKRIKKKANKTTVERQDFKEIKVPEHQLTQFNSDSVASREISLATANGSSLGTSNVETRQTSLNVGAEPTLKRKLNETSSDNNIQPKKMMIEPVIRFSKQQNKVELDLKDPCIMCEAHEKDGVFIHGANAHCCCCYTCTVRTWKYSRRCPICNRRVLSVVKLYKA